MRLTFTATILLIAAATLGVGCSPTLAPIYSPAQTAGLAAGGAPYTADQIQQAVASGAQQKGWTIVQSTPGVTVAEVTSGGHSARVRILSNESGWRVVHEQSSPGLKHATDDKHGEVIHRRYNHWVRQLDDAIRQALASQGSTVAPGSGGAAPVPTNEPAPTTEPAPATEPAPTTAPATP